MRRAPGQSGERTHRGNWLGALMLLVVGLLLPALAGAATFKVMYSGVGHFKSNYQSDVSNNAGDCSTTRIEDTHFSWLYATSLNAGGGHGVRAAGASAQPVANPLGPDNSAQVTINDSGAGCAGSDGKRVPTRADCHGESMPWPGERARLTLSAAPANGRSTLTAFALGTQGLHTKDFSGAWAGSDGTSCAGFFASQSADTLGLPLFGFSGVLRAKFPIKVSTLESLKPGRYFRVNVQPGHYAAKPNCVTGTCDLSWRGTVRVTRTG